MNATQNRDPGDECSCTTCALDKPQQAWRPEDLASTASAVVDVCTHEDVISLGGVAECLRCHHIAEGCKHALGAIPVTMTLLDGTVQCWYCYWDRASEISHADFISDDPIGEIAETQWSEPFDWGASRPEAEAFR